MSSRMFSYYITTPIFYVNAAPHVGHIHTLFLADALNIFNRLLMPGTSTIFSTGTDEHGLKVQMAAQNKQVPCLEFCHKNSNKFKQLFERHNLTISDFIRTTQENHLRAVEYFWNRLDKNGAIYKSTYEGWYSANEETFVPQSQIMRSSRDGCGGVVSDINGNTLEWYQEENYMFKLSEYRDEINTWLRQNNVIKPNKFNELAITMMGTSDTEIIGGQKQTKSLSDISISRPASRLDWGIKVPNDPNHTVYVWLDALINYLTAVGYPQTLKRWPIDCQVIGKDILKFHAIYWPAFLLAAKMTLPKNIICHSHWLIDSMKMSKSKGNVVDPTSEADILTDEGLRYYLLRSSPPHSDTDYSQLQAIRCINAELADNLGNLVNRCCAHKINPKQEIPLRMFNSDISSQLKPICNSLVNSLGSLTDQCQAHYGEANFNRGVDQIMACLKMANNLFQEAQPWTLVRKIDLDERARMQHNDILRVIFECLRICSILLMPIVPKTSKRILDRLNLNYLNCSWDDAKLRLSDNESKRLNSNTEAIIFRKVKSQ